jgi:hypothetical protein
MSHGLVSPTGESAIRQLTGDNSIFDMVATGKDLQVSPEVEEQIQALMGTMTETGEAKFLLDVYFNEERSIHRPFSGFLMAWTNGGFAHGGGDEKVYFCPSKVERNGQTKICAAPMAPNLIKHGVGVCVACQQPSRDKQFVGEVYFKLGMSSWAAVIERYFFRLECNADIRLGIMRGDLRKTTEIEQTSERQGELLENLRFRREWVRYSLKSIIKDGTSGATLESRLNAFLRA